MILPDDHLLSEELISRMAHYDGALAEGTDPSFLDAVPLSSSLQPQWRGLENCLRLLRDVYPARPATLDYLGQLPRTFGRFRIRGEIGRGGFGIVFLADDPQLSRSVALKVPRPDALFNADLRERFLREARAAAALDHPNLVTVYESGEVAGICYIASAYCPGLNMAQWLHSRPGPVSPWTAATLIACLATAVQHAHDRGILHRDLKPSNVLLVPRTAKTIDSANDQFELEFIPKLTDFGLAKLLEAESDQTRSGIVLGTPVYMAPEQAEGWSNQVGAATDVYALGVMLYELLTRRLPFQGVSLVLTLEQLRSEEPLPPRRIVSELPRDVETICLKCLRKDPRQRYASADALAQDLHRFLRREPIHGRRAGLGTRLLDWCRRPQRIRDAAAIALFNGLAGGGMSCVGMVLLLSGILSTERLFASAAIFLVGMVGFGLPMIWTFRKTLKRNVRALWVGVFMPVIWPATALIEITGWVDAGGILDAQNRAMLWAQIALIGSLTMIQIVGYVTALMAYYANRHRPGFVPQPSLGPTILDVSSNT
jgi:hypothetical protein